MPARRLPLVLAALLLSLIPAGVGARQPAVGPPAPARPPQPPPSRLSFRINLDENIGTGRLAGRLLVFLLYDDGNLPPNAQPAQGMFYDNPQPLFGVGVANFAPGQAVTLDDRADAFPVKPSALAKGEYLAQAVLDCVHTNSLWFREAGNVRSEIVRFAYDPAKIEAPVRITLEKIVPAPYLPKMEGIEIFEAKSDTLSTYYKTPIGMRAGILLPSDYDPSRKYPAVYQVPGFNGDHFDAMGILKQSMMRPFPAELEFRKNCFIIVLDPSSANGHTLFANSANNGPVGDALVHDLIPALEAKYPLIPEASARIVRGHSSGGWSSLWLALNYPETFGACWSSSPDPVDFRRFQKIDIYAQPNMYTDAQGKDIPSNFAEGESLMSVRQENAWEEVKGPRNSSGEQWDSWQAVFGPIGPDGNPAALYNAVTGVIDKAVAEQYRKYDVADLLRGNPEKYVPIFKRGVRILVGGADEWNLHEAVMLLKEDLARLGAPMDAKAGGAGSITIVPGKDHGTILLTPEYQTQSEQILRALRAAGHIPSPQTPDHHPESTP